MSALAPLSGDKRTYRGHRRNVANDPGCVKTSPAHRHGEWFFINREIKSATMNLPSSNSDSTEVHSMHHSRHHVFTQPRPLPDIDATNADLRSSSQGGD